MQKQQRISDEELVSTIRTQDKEQYAELVERYQDKLMRYATFLLRDNQKAADVVQDSFIKAYINLNGFNTKKKFSSWIYRIVHNESINAIKKKRMEVTFFENFDYRSNENLEEDYINREYVKKAQECLQEISLIYREPLVLYYLEEKSYEEISDILRIPINTVATRISRAKTIMKKICQRKK